MMISDSQRRENAKRLSKFLGKNIPKGTWDRFECIEYLHQLNDEEVAYIVKFYDERYNDGISFTEPDNLLHHTDEMRKEARRIHNNSKRDAFNVASKKHALVSVEHKDYKNFMEAASDDWEWQDAFKVLGHKEAVLVIYEQTKEDLNANKKIDLVLSKFYVKMRELERYKRIDNLTKGKK